MEAKVLDHLSGLPDWMQFTILILILIGFYGFLFYSNKRSKKTQEIASLTGDKINQLLDVLYEKYANDLTAEVANNTIYIYYQVMKYNTMENILMKLYDKSNTDFTNEDSLKAFKEDLSVFIKNKYYETSLELGKMKYKGVPLNFYMTEKMFPNDIVEQVMNFIKCKRQYTNEKLFRELNTRINGIFDTYTNKTYKELEDKFKK